MEPKDARTILAELFQLAEKNTNMLLALDKKIDAQNSEMQQIRQQQYEYFADSALTLQEIAVKATGKMIKPNKSKIESAQQEFGKRVAASTPTKPEPAAPEPATPAAPEPATPEPATLEPATPASEPSLKEKVFAYWKTHDPPKSRGTWFKLSYMEFGTEFLQLYIPSDEVAKHTGTPDEIFKKIVVWLKSHDNVIAAIQSDFAKIGN